MGPFEVAAQTRESPKNSQVPVNLSFISLYWEEGVEVLRAIYKTGLDRRLEQGKWYKRQEYVTDTGSVFDIVCLLKLSTVLFFVVQGKPKLLHTCIKFYSLTIPVEASNLKCVCKSNEMKITCLKHQHYSSQNIYFTIQWV